MSTASSFAEPDRLVAEVVADVVGSGRRGVALVEHEVEDGEHRAQALGEQVVGRHAERDPGAADLPLRADEPLRHRGLGDEEGVRDLGRREPADLAQRERDAALGRERGVAAGEDERQPVVGDRAHVVLLGRQLLEACEQLGLLLEDALAPDAVDRAVARRGDDPGSGIARHAVARPALERRGEGVLHRVLGELEVAEDAGEDRDRMAPLLAEDLLDVRCMPPLLHDRADLDRSAALCRRDQRGQPDRLVEVGKLGEEDAADDLLRLRERAVGDDALSVADA